MVGTALQEVVSFEASLGINVESLRISHEVGPSRKKLTQLSAATISVGGLSYQMGVVETRRLTNEMENHILFPMYDIQR